MVDGVTRHGKFLDIDAGGTHLVLHLARAGWVRWKDEVPKRAGAAQQQVAAGRADRARQRRRARRHRGRHPQEPGALRRPRPGRRRGRSPGSGRTRSPTTSPSMSSTRSCSGPAARRSRACCGCRATSRASATPTPTSCCTPRGCRRSSRPTVSTTTELQTLYDAIRTVLGEAVERADGLAASELKGEKKSHLAVHGRTGETCPVCGDVVREVSFADSSLQYCADLPDRRQAAGGPPNVQAAEVTCQS